MRNKPSNPRPLYIKERSRRSFLRTVGLGATVVGASLLGLIPVARRWVKRLRPPGALGEPDFLAACIKCGQCVQVCPVSAIKLADITDGYGLGVPFIEARNQACDFSCDGLQCVLACPTGALDHDLDYPHQTEMAVAALVRPNGCLAAQGKGVKGKARADAFKGKLRYAEVDRWNPIPVNDYEYDLEICDLCVRQCPIEIRIAQCEAGEPPSGDENQCPPEHAIRMVTVNDDGKVKKMKPEILEGCVGCGVCEMICPAEPAAIEVDFADSRWGIA